MTLTLSVDARLARVTTIVVSIARLHAVSCDFAPTDSLVDGGMTSVAMVELMLAVEREFDLMIPDKELSADNFLSIAALDALLARLDANSCGGRQSQ